MPSGAESLSSPEFKLIPSRPPTRVLASYMLLKSAIDIPPLPVKPPSTTTTGASVSRAVGCTPLSSLSLEYVGSGLDAGGEETDISSPTATIFPPIRVCLTADYLQYHVCSFLSIQKELQSFQTPDIISCLYGRALERAITWSSRVQCTTPNPQTTRAARFMSIDEV
jgi:hypothetical protein